MNLFPQEFTSEGEPNLITLVATWRLTNPQPHYLIGGGCCERMTNQAPKDFENFFTPQIISSRHK